MPDRTPFYAKFFSAQALNQFVTEAEGFPSVDIEALYHEDHSVKLTVPEGYYREILDLIDDFNGGLL